MMKRIGLFILLSIYSVSNALGYDIEVDQLQYLLNVETSTVSYCGISSEYKRSYINRRTRQTLWSAVQMLTQKLCCQTIHDCPKVVPLHYESE